MGINVGDTIELKKTHPCGSRLFTVQRIGIDFKIKCQKCGHQIMIPRAKIENRIRKIYPNNTEQVNNNVR